MTGFVSACDSEISDLRGTVAADGAIALLGSSSTPDLQLNIWPMTVSQWRTTVIGTTMVGSFTCTVYYPGSTTASFVVTATLTNVNLVSSNPNVPF